MIGAESVAARVVDQLAAGEFTEATVAFDSIMRAQLPAETLKSGWESLVSQLGPYRGRGEMQTTQSGGHVLVLVPCEAERGSFVVQVAIDRGGRVSGLYLKPAARTDFLPPPYVDGGAFEERSIRVGAGDWAVPGTLAIPRQRGTRGRQRMAPCAVLVHGSGPNDRDETVGGVKPFRDIAWGLACRGVAVLRYEKRTRVHPTRIQAETITVKDEVLDDALAAVAAVRAEGDIDPERIFVAGHSLGGSLCPTMGALDEKIRGLIVMAGGTKPVEDALLEQSTYLAQLGRLDPAAVADLKRRHARVKKLRSGSRARAKDLPLGVPAGYWLSLREYDPALWVERARQPMIVLWGERDYQVTRDDLDGWVRLLKSRQDVTLKTYPSLNHLFVDGRGPSTPDEYEVPGNVAKVVIDDVAEWIKDVSG